MMIDDVSKNPPCLPTGRGSFYNTMKNTQIRWSWLDSNQHLPSQAGVLSLELLLQKPPVPLAHHIPQGLWIVPPSA